MLGDKEKENFCHGKSALLPHQRRREIFCIRNQNLKPYYVELHYKSQEGFRKTSFCLIVASRKEM